MRTDSGGNRPGENVTPTDKNQDGIDAKAADWAARLGGDRLSTREREALDRWLE